MNGFVVVAQDLLAILVMLGILLQTPKATGLGGVIGGGSVGGGGYRRRRGMEGSLFKATWVFVILFALISILATVGTYRG